MCTMYVYIVHSLYPSQAGERDVDPRGQLLDSSLHCKRLFLISFALALRVDREEFYLTMEGK